jgi:Bacterial protein of unknown function (DUF885)
MAGLDRFFESYYRFRPVNATFTGVHDYDDSLPDYSPDGIGAAVDEMRTILSSLQDVPADDSSLRDVATRDRALAASFLEVQIAEAQSLHFQRGNPSLALGEAVFGVISLITRPFAPATQRARSLRGRLDAIPQFLAGARRSIVDGVPEHWRARCLHECEGAARLLQTGVATWMVAESLDDPGVIRAAEAAAAAVDEYRRWLTNELPAAPAGRYSAGAQFFDLLLKRGHQCQVNASSLAIESRKALDDALELLDRRARTAAPGGYAEVQARLAAAHPSPSGYLSAHQQIWNECRKAAEDADLVTWPDYPIRYVPIPEQTRDAAPFLYYLFYRSPAAFECIAVHDYVVTPVDDRLTAEEQERRLRAANHSVIKLNHVVHHGAIGHHVQNYYAYHGESEIGRVAAIDCASRIGMFLGGSMAEGWACYATDLMDEIGFLDADESLAQQHTRARLLARAVVDLGLHDGSLTFDDAVGIYRDRVGMPLEAARGEACKNSMFPATAIMYWVGTEGLHHLRRARERAEGSAFSLRRFHDRVLSHGSIPVPLLERIW